MTTHPTTRRTTGTPGAGTLGRPTGRYRMAVGRTAAFGSRIPERTAEAVEAYGAGASAVSLADAADFGGVVLLCVADPAREELPATPGDPRVAVGR